MPTPFGNDKRRAAGGRTRNPKSNKGGGAGRRGRRGGPRRSREPDASVRGRATARTASPSSGTTSRPRRNSPGRAPWRRRPRHAGVQHVIWSTLEDTRKWVPLATTACPRSWASTRSRTSTPRAKPIRLHRARRADDVPADVVLLGQLHLLRHGPEEGSGRHARAHAARWATRSCPGSRPRTSAGARTASSSEEASSSARPSASPASTSPARRWPLRSRRRSGRRCATTRCRPRCIAASASRRRGSRQHVPVQARLREAYFCGARNLDVSRGLNPALQTFDRRVKHGGRPDPVDRQDEA